jgi:DNA-binding protein H-NS
MNEDKLVKELNKLTDPDQTKLYFEKYSTDEKIDHLEKKSRVLEQLVELFQNKITSLKKRFDSDKPEIKTYERSVNHYTEMLEKNNSELTELHKKHRDEMMNLIRAPPVNRPPPISRSPSISSSASFHSVNNSTHGSPMDIDSSFPSVLGKRKKMGGRKSKKTRKGKFRKGKSRKHRSYKK